jgi:flagellar basal-body rod protein FlgF
MDKLIHTALNSLNNARVRQNVSSQNLSNAQVPGFRGDEIGGRFGSIFLESDETLSTRVFTKKSEPGLFSDLQGELRQTGEQTDVAITGKGYLLIEGKSGELGMSRRGDLTIALDKTLRNGANEPVLDTSLTPITMPPFKKLFVSESGQIYIQPAGTPAGTRVLVNQLAMTSGDELDLEKDVDGTIRPKGGFIREKFNADQNVRLKQGYLETSNVSVFDELINNTEIQKQYQLNVKLIALAKEMDEAGSALMRLPNN